MRTKKNIVTSTAIATLVAGALGTALLVSAASPDIDQARVDFMGYCVPSQVTNYALMNDDFITVEEAIDRCASVPGDEDAYRIAIQQKSDFNE